MTSMLKSKVVVTPTGSNVLVRERKATTSAGGIILTSAGRPIDTFTAEVVAVGPGRLLPNGGTEPTSFKPGMRVIMHSGANHAATPRIRVGDETLLLVTSEQILATVEDND